MYIRKVINGGDGLQKPSPNANYPSYLVPKQHTNYPKYHPIHTYTSDALSIILELFHFRFHFPILI